MTFDPPDDERRVLRDPGAARLVPGPGRRCTWSPLATLAGCAAARPDLDWDVRRFRPNLVLDVDIPAFGEQEWVGKQVAWATWC